MKILPVIFCLCLTLLTVDFAGATTLVDSLNKQFKRFDYPHETVTARITLQTEIPDIVGDRLEDSVLLAYKIQAKLVSVFKKNGWQPEDSLLTDVLDAGLVELEVDKGMNLKFGETLRLKAFVYQCDFPMRKYRGGSIEKFFEGQVLEKEEECFTADEKLREKNYPY